MISKLNWFEALTLDERIALNLTRIPASALDRDEGLACERIDKWKRWRLARTVHSEHEQYPLLPYSDSVLAHAFALKLNSTAERFAPKWVPAIKLAYVDSVGSRLKSAELKSRLLVAVEPLVRKAKKDFVDGFRGILVPSPILKVGDDEIFGVFSDILYKRLAAYFMRTLVLELQVAKLSGELTGGIGEERFRQFFDKLANADTCLSILAEYPVLLRRAVECAELWCSSSIEMLVRLSADWEALVVAIPELKAARALTRVSIAGDYHCSGRAVTILECDNGVRFVYKPHSIAVDVFFQKVLHWLNRNGFDPAFRTLVLLDRGEYGWSEFVSEAPCRQPEELGRFYRRHGAYLALLHCLAGTDFHHENIIASGEFPILIDLEGLFTPRLPAERQFCDTGAQTALNESVLRTGLLPQYLLDPGGAAIATDVSGLGGRPGQTLAYKATVLSNGDTDEAGFTFARLVLQKGQHLPTLNGTAVSAATFAADILRAFDDVCRIVLDQKHELAESDGLLASLTGLRTRVIMRPTMFYQRLLENSFHPDYLRSALDIDLLYTLLWNPAEQSDQHRQLISLEKAALLRGDVPMFWTTPLSRDLYGGDGSCVVDYFEESGTARVLQRLKNLDDRTIRFQRWLIEASLVTADGATAVGPLADLRPVGSSTTSLYWRDAARELAIQIGDRLIGLSFKQNGALSWVGMTLHREIAWVAQRLGIDLYSGMPGPVLFLAYLGAITRDEKYICAAREAYHTVSLLTSDFIDRKPSPGPIGAFQGLAGLLYMNCHLAQLWTEREHLENAKAISNRLRKLLATDQDLDVVGGLPGALVCFLCLFDVTRDRDILDLATVCGEQMIATCRQSLRGLIWESRLSQWQPLTGFSHGNAGRAWALQKLAVRVQQFEFYNAAAAAIEYESSTYSVDYANWPDFRKENAETEPPKTPKFAVDWCHGAPGIGLSRIPFLRTESHDLALSDITNAFWTTYRGGFGRSHCLCHGDLGTYECLEAMASALGKPELRGYVDEIGSSIVERVRESGPLCGTPGYIEVPGLMTGLAGIGFGLLRISCNEKLPSIVRLDGPDTY